MRLSKNTPAKADEEFEIPSEPITPSVFSSPAPSTPRPATGGFSSGSPAAVIGPKISFKGELTGEEDLLIQGRVEGTIDLKGNHLTIGKQGVVKANLMAKTITIEGTVEGDLIGQERIEIKSSSNVKGNLIAARVTLEDGAKFRGSIDMDSQTSTSAPKYTAPVSEKAD
jgi:cytoskeletal protein CcmA (bactofilin family)